MVGPLGRAPTFMANGSVKRINLTSKEGPYTSTARYPHSLAFPTRPHQHGLVHPANMECALVDVSDGTAARWASKQQHGQPAKGRPVKRRWQACFRGATIGFTAKPS